MRGPGASTDDVTALPPEGHLGTASGFAAKGEPEFVPVGYDTDLQARVRLVRLAAYAALAIAGRLVLLGFPNVALTFFVVFMAGALEGALFGALVGLVAMTVTNLMLSGLHPVLLANGAAMAMIGIVGGLSGRWLLRPANDRIGRALRHTVLFVSGFFGTLLFSVLSDLGSYVLAYGVTPEGRGVGSGALGAYLMAGLAFNLVPGLLNSVPFVAGTVPVGRALQRANLAPERR